VCSRTIDSLAPRCRPELRLSDRIRRYLPTLQLMTFGRKTVDLHILCIGNIGGTVVSDRNVITERARRGQLIALFEGLRMQIEGLQSRLRLWGVMRPRNRRKHAQRVLVFSSANTPVAMLPRSVPLLHVTLQSLPPGCFPCVALRLQIGRLRIARVPCVAPWDQMTQSRNPKRVRVPKSNESAVHCAFLMLFVQIDS
jgi:hypothetical protein